MWQSGFNERFSGATPREKYFPSYLTNTFLPFKPIKFVHISE
jgi:hypothetical protein